MTRNKLDEVLKKYHPDYQPLWDVCKFERWCQGKKEQLSRPTDVLSPREFDILFRRQDGETLTSIAKSYGISCSRIYQIEKTAKLRLRQRFRTNAAKTH